MKPKSKTIKTETKPEETKQQTTELATKATLWDALDKITKDLTPGDSREVQVQAHGIQDDLAVMHQKKDAIAARLAIVRVKLGGENFRKFAEDFMPRLGVSPSTTYRWLESGQQVKAVIPDPTMRQTLIGRLDGKPLTTTDDKGAVILLPAFEKALAAIPMPAKHDDGHGNEVYKPEDIDTYTAAVISKTRELGAKKKSSKAQLKKARRDKLVDLFTSYMDEYGPKDAEALLNELDQLHTAVVKTIEGPKQAPAAPAAKKAAIN